MPLNPSLPFFLYRCPLCHLQFDFPTDAFDFCDESSPGATEGQKGRTGKSSDKSKDSGTGLKKIFSGPKKVSEGFFISLYWSNDVRLSSVWVTFSHIHGHLKLLRWPSPPVYWCFNFINFSGQLAYINQAVGGEGQRGNSTVEITFLCFLDNADWHERVKYVTAEVMNVPYVVPSIKEAVYSQAGYISGDKHRFLPLFGSGWFVICLWFSVFALPTSSAHCWF